jgi:hypothetical protein
LATQVSSTGKSHILQQADSDFIYLTKATFTSHCDLLSLTGLCG